jgi:hypothetical protein
MQSRTRKTYQDYGQRAHSWANYKDRPPEILVKSNLNQKNERTMPDTHDEETEWRRSDYFAAQWSTAHLWTENMAIAYQGGADSNSFGRREGRHVHLVHKVSGQKRGGWLFKANGDWTYDDTPGRMGSVTSKV